MCADCGSGGAHCAIAKYQLLLRLSNPIEGSPRLDIALTLTHFIVGGYEVQTLSSSPEGMELSYATREQRILVAEDDEQVAHWLKRIFEDDGHIVDVSYDGASALANALANTYALAVIDLDMPQLDGLSVVRQVRAAGRAMPVLIMTAAASDEDVESGLDAGADDFLTKPVSIQVLRARARAAMRRAPTVERQVMGFGDVTIDRNTYRARGPLGEVPLTAKEFELLQYMINNAAQVIPRKKLLLHVWGYDFDPGTNVLEVALSRVRHRLTEVTKSLRLRTLRGQGVLLEFVRAGDADSEKDE
jgi:DNA-binding response OmpR family regulator